MKRQGSALIVAMMLIAGIGAVAFGIGRLIFIETATATLYENGIVAYYGAESGIEEAFLRYKFDKNTAVPANGSTIDLTSDATFRANLVDKTVNQASAFSASVGSTEINEELYDLRMNYLGTWSSITTQNINPWLGNDLSTEAGTSGSDNKLTKEDMRNGSYTAGDYSSLFVSKDNAAKFDLTGIDLDNNSAKLLLLFSGSTLTDTTAAKCYAVAELKISITESNKVKEYKDLTSYNGATCYGASYLKLSSPNKLLSPNPSGSNYLSSTLFYVADLRDVLTRAGITFSHGTGTPVTLTVRPLYYDLKIGLYARDCGSAPGNCYQRTDVITGPYTYIATRGYFGGVTRTLRANIDRQSGTLYDLFDYVLFKEN